MQHVLLLSVDGMHANDLTRWVESHPDSALARLSRNGVTFSDARSPTPSDSFPGLLALVTGGTPRSTGVYYDDSYDRTLFPPGSNCSGSPGTEVVYDDTVDLDSSTLFTGIDPKNLPLERDASGCRPVFPHAFVKVNTVFEVVKAAGRRSAWSDKHPAYDLVNGPSGKGVDELYTPEINSPIANGRTVQGIDLAGTLAKCDGTNSLPPRKVRVYNDCIPTQEAYDDVKVEAVLHWIRGEHADGSQWGPDGRPPAIFGTNFQAVSVAQKLPVGGYVDAEGTPSANLVGAIAHTDASIGRMVAALERSGLLDSTLIVVTAKHGQSPIDRTHLAMEGGRHAPVQTVRDPLDFIHAVDPDVDEVAFTNPNNGHSFATKGHVQTDAMAIVWLQDQSPANVSQVVAQLQANRKAMFADALPPDASLSQSITSGDALATIFGEKSDALAAAREPDVLIQPNAGVIYSASSKKIAEHGSATLDDTRVALLVSSPRLHASSVTQRVNTTQVAPTILQALGLDPRVLQSARAEGTRPLPGLWF